MSDYDKNYNNKLYPQRPDNPVEPPLRSRMFVSGPQIYWVVVDKVGVIGGEFYDILTALPAPCNTFFIGSVLNGAESNSILMSLAPLGLPRGFAFSNFRGTEQVWYLTANPQVLFPNGPHYYSVIHLSMPVNQVYFHIGAENGTLARYSIACMLTDEQFSIHGGLYA